MKISLLIGWCFIATVASGQYKKTGKCNDNPCVYEYQITGEMHDKRGKEESRLTTEVTLKCETVGIYKNQRVKRYCIEVKKMQANMFEKKQNKKRKNKEKISDNSIMNGWFCFVRNDNGHILSVFHSPKEKTDVVNFKKTIVSSFQANFAKTSTEEETDAQSKHTSHYKYKKKGKDTVEYRTVSSKDVSKYAGKASKKNVEFNSKESLKVDENRIIREAHGESKTSLTKENKKEERITGKNEDIPPIETKSVYTLKLKKCLPMKSNEMAWIASDTHAAVTDSIMARYNEYEHDKAEMEELYDELPELRETIQEDRLSKRSISNNDEDHALSKWSQLLYLESKYGPLNGRQPKIMTLINTLEEIMSIDTQYYKNLRLTIYGLLSSEGSMDSQEALLKALHHNQMESDEYNDILTAITLLQTMDHSVLSEYKQYVLANGGKDDQLLLSLATLGRHKNVEKEVVNTITGLMEGQGINDTDTLVYYVHALGNTGSRLIIPYLTPLLLNEELRVTAIDALRTVSTDTSVQMMFTDLCDGTSEASTVLAIIDSIRFPYESFLYYPEPPEQPEDEHVLNDLITNIVHLTIHYDDPQLYNATRELLNHIETNITDELLTLLSSHNHTTRSLTKRAKSSNWSSRNSLYNLISSRASRVSDKQAYPYHKAFLWGKKLGPSKIHMKMAVGGFGGAGLKGMKVFGKGVVNLYVFGRTVSVVHAEYLNRVSKGQSAFTKQYIKIFGSTLLHKTSTVPLPYHMKWRKNHFRIQILRLRYSIFVWVGFLRFYIGASVSFDTTMALKMDYRIISAQVDIGPTFTVTGGASVTLLIFFRVGLEIKASIGYYITPKGSVTLCDSSPVADASACFGIYHGSKGLFVDIYAYFRKRRCRFKGWRLRCRWGRMKRLRLFSSKFTFGRSLQQKLLWGRCLACTCKGSMHNMCAAIRGTTSTGGQGCSCRVTSYY